MRPPLPTMVLLPLGTLLQNGQYRLEQLLGHRGGELTYEGTHLPSQQTVLIRTLNPSHNPPDEIAHQREAYLQQAQAWKNLKHPHLEPIRDVFVESVLPFLISDKISEQTGANLAGDQPLLAADAIAKISQIGGGVDLIHQHHLQHGDIRPENIVLHPQTHHPILVNRVWKTLANALSSSTIDHAYAAPEIYEGQQTVASDIYGLAATFYTLVTGQVPITARQRQHIRLELQHPDLSQATVVAILRGMAMQPQHRPHSVLEWIELLPKEHLQPASFSVESGNIGAVSPPLAATTPSAPEESPAPEEPSSSESSASDPEDIVAAPSPDSTVPLEEQTQTVSTTRLQPYPVAPRFPFRALIVCAVLSGVVGVAFGLLLRFHYQNQFNNPQVPAKNTPVKNEPFLPKSRPTDLDSETLPAPDETPIEQPTPSTIEEPAITPRYDQRGIEEETLSPQEPNVVTPDPFATDSIRPDLQPSPDPYPETLTPEASPTPFDPYATPDLTLPPTSDPPSDFQ